MSEVIIFLKNSNFYNAYALEERYIFIGEGSLVSVISFTEDSFTTFLHGTAWKFIVQEGSIVSASDFFANPLMRAKEEEELFSIVYPNINLSEETRYLG